MLMLRLRGDCAGDCAVQGAVAKKVQRSRGCLDKVPRCRCRCKCRGLGLQSRCKSDVEVMS